jgi:hypothetical protein
MNEPKNTRARLSDIKRENPFGVPERYFDDFSARLRDKILAEEKTTGHLRYLPVLRPYLAAAGVVVAALLAGFYYFNNQPGMKAARFHAEVSRTVEQELYSISEETILEVLDAVVSEQSAGSSVDSGDAINYLMDEDLNEQELIDAL